MKENRVTQIFISYSRKDLKFVEGLASDLKKAGFEVWYDFLRLRGGERWRIEIQNALKASQCVITVLSPDSVASEWVEREFLFASSLKRRIIPLLLRECKLPLNYLDLNYIDVRDENYQRNFDKILEVLKELSGSHSIYTSSSAEVRRGLLPTRMLAILIPLCLILAGTLYFLASNIFQETPLTSQPISPQPVAHALADKAGGMTPLTVNFSGSRSEGIFTTVMGSFGEGGNSNETNPTYVFLRSGIYGSQLTISGRGGNDQTTIPVVVAPQSNEPLNLSVWLTSNDFNDFDLKIDDWTNTFPAGSKIFFRDMTELIIPYIKNEAPLAAGDPDVLYISSETMLHLDELFFQGYSVYTYESGDQPPVLAIFAFPHLTPLLDEYVVSYPVDRTKFAQRDAVIYGIPYHNGYLVPVASDSNRGKPTQAFFFSMWLHLTQAAR
jgi:PKD repeat protein